MATTNTNEVSFQDAFQGDEEFFGEVEDYRSEQLELMGDKIEELKEEARSIQAELAAESNSPQIYTCEEIQIMANEHQILSSGDWNDGNFDEVELADKLHVAVVLEGGEIVWPSPWPR